MQREVILHQRSEAETLLKELTRAQMTRRYWGEFAGSLQDLGLSSGPQFQATLDCDPLRTRLWLEPQHCMEAYLAEWSARAVGCGCTTAVVIGKEQPRPRRGTVRMVGRRFNWIDWLFLFLAGKDLFRQNILQTEFTGFK